MFRQQGDDGHLVLGTQSELSRSRLPMPRLPIANNAQQERTVRAPGLEPKWLRTPVVPFLAMTVAHVMRVRPSGHEHDDPNSALARRECVVHRHLGQCIVLALLLLAVVRFLPDSTPALVPFLATLNHRVVEHNI